ncbi:hypothetical protein H8356DRAFT_1355722 [Neocallimastix lanati (nom. inval.)]|nr:hypothetical protein H8356DRAFT_1355722 [Neocallimastix sp. JGI-2020a]
MSFYNHCKICFYPGCLFVFLTRGFSWNIVVMTINKVTKVHFMCPYRYILLKSNAFTKEAIAFREVAFRQVDTYHIGLGKLGTGEALGEKAY